MEKHEDNNVNSPTSYFTYHELFGKCKKLNTESESSILKKTLFLYLFLLFFSLEKENKKYVRRNRLS